MENKFVEFRYCLRTVQTKGSIQKIYWSDEEEKSTDDDIPSKLTIYGEAATNARGDMIWNDGCHKVEQSMALRVAHASVGKFGAKTSS
jgi:hypothetical protein